MRKSTLAVGLAVIAATALSTMTAAVAAEFQVRKRRPAYIPPPQPAYEQPAYQQQPVYEQPAYPEPVYQPPVYQQPMMVQQPAYLPAPSSCCCPSVRRGFAVNFGSIQLGCGGRTSHLAPIYPPAYPVHAYPAYHQQETYQAAPAHYPAAAPYPHPHPGYGPMVGAGVGIGPVGVGVTARY